MLAKSDILAELKTIEALELQIEARMIAGLTDVADEHGQVVTAERAQEKIKELARQLFDDESMVNPVLLIITDGALVFGNELVRELKLLQQAFPEKNYHFQVMSKSSATYKGMESTVTSKTTAEHVTQGSKDKILLAGRHVVIVDDLADTGATDRLIRADCARKGATKIKSMVWFNKVQPKAANRYEPEYSGFKIKNIFVLGLGMDYYGLGRNHPKLGFVDKSTIATAEEVKKITTRKEELAQLLEQCILREEQTHYKHASRNRSRTHAFAASSKDEKVLSKFPNLHGDALKTAILLDLKSQLALAENKDALSKIIQRIETSEEYKILKTGQGITTRLFSLKTDSIRALNEMIDEAYAKFSPQDLVV